MSKAEMRYASGTRYHRSEACAGAGRFKGEVRGLTIAKARQRGLKACKRCAREDAQGDV